MIKTATGTEIAGDWSLHETLVQDPCMVHFPIKRSSIQLAVKRNNGFKYDTV